MTPFASKIDFIIPAIAGKRVLDLGCVQHVLSNAVKETWLHAHIQKHALNVLGVDLLKEEVQALRAQGYDMVAADVETMDLGKTFEVVVAGDIIEHLGNPGAFMARVHAHLEPEGRFIITTPNPVTFLRFVRLLLLGWIGGNDEHTCWFTRRTMRRLAGMYGFRVERVAYVDDIYHWYFEGPWRWLIPSLPFLAVNWIFCRIRPQLSETLVFVLAKGKA
ncbi:MAG: class I SAM-dependent methyltransferase [Fibrobacterota bacterium]|nr:class I SAM-dependent methyltransferase [Fibrobacterota bacterium]